MMRRLLFVVAVMLLFCGCRSVPYSGRTQFVLSGESSENAAGTQAWNELRKKEKISTDTTKSAALNRVGPAIAAVSDRKDFQWEFAVFESKEPNAFCLPGGKVAVYSALFAYTANDAELATVVAHEVAHAIARHGGEQASWDTLIGLGGVAVSAATDHKGAAALYGVTTDLGVAKPFSRRDEYEADQIGLMLMAKAGYDPMNALNFWAKFGKLASGGWLSTHPGGADRLAELRKLMPDAQTYYRKAPVKRGNGETLIHVQQ